MAYDGTTIASLDATKPLGSESPSIADDAIREIKRAVKNDVPPLQTDVSTLKNTTVPALQTDVSTLKNTTVPALQSQVNTIQNTTIPNLDSAYKAADTTLQENINAVFNQTVYIPGSNDGNFSYVYAIQTSGITVNANTPTYIPFNNELSDLKGEFNNSTGRFTAASGGLYVVSFQIRVTGSEGAWVVGRILLNGEEIFRAVNNIPAGSTTCYAGVSHAVKLAAGDLLRCTGELSSSGWITEDYTKLTIVRVH